MAGKITTNSVVLGDSITDTQNFVLKTNADGTATMARGALGGLGTVFGVNGSSAITGATLVAPALGTPASGNLANCVINSKIQPITASVAASALTITLNPTILDFRASPLTSGTVTTIDVPAAISVTIPSTSTMGTVSAVQSRIVVIAINNAGTVELAAVNIAGGALLDETTLITTTAAVAAGNSATAYYSTTARTSVAYRVVGYVESTQATAGTWATAPSTLQGYGGQALAAMSSLGYGQTWQNVTASRANATTYYNTTGKPICLSIAGTSTGSSVITVGGQPCVAFSANSTSTTAMFAIVPAGMTYITAGITGLTYWNELR